MRSCINDGSNLHACNPIVHRRDAEAQRFFLCNRSHQGLYFKLTVIFIAGEYLSTEDTQSGEELK